MVAVAQPSITGSIKPSWGSDLRSRLHRQADDRRSGAGVAPDCTEAGKLSSSTAMRHIGPAKAAMGGNTNGSDYLATAAGLTG
jgi:hypothetical protein